VAYRRGGGAKTCEHLDVCEETLGPLVGIIEEQEHDVPGLDPMAYPSGALVTLGGGTLRVPVPSHLLRQQHREIIHTRGSMRERHDACPRLWEGGEGL
jgi:hypothetical protein